MHNCRACLSGELSTIIALGYLPLANAILTEPTHIPEPKFNLEVMLCANCGLAQLKELIDPILLFSNYVYFSSNSDAMLASAATLANRNISTLPNDPFIIEIASNDGYLLKNYIKAGIKVLGIDPAENIAKLANANGIPTLCDFFGESLARKLILSGKKADIIHANNVMAHVPDLNGFIKGLKILLQDRGQAIIEVPYFLDLVKNLEFDTIYHEHVYYFSVQPLKAAFAKHGLEIINIEKLSLHGGSLRLFVSHTGQYLVDPIIEQMIRAEEAFGLYELNTFKNFMDQLAILKTTCVHTLADLKEKNAKIAAYGASAKGTTLLNYFGLGKDTIEFVVDRSLTKHDKFTPGTQLAISHPDRLIDEKISHALLLTWNFSEEIIQQQKEFINQGGKFIHPLAYGKMMP